MIEQSVNATNDALIVIVDDVNQRLVLARKALVGMKFTDRGGNKRTLADGDIATWLVETKTCIANALVEAAKPGPQILVADLSFFDGDANEAAAVDIATDVLRPQVADRPYIARWFATPYAEPFLPALALVHTFASAQPGQRAVCVASDHHTNPAELGFFEGLPVTDIGHCGGLLAETRQMVRWIERVLDGWTLEHLWRGTSEWFGQSGTPDGIPPHDPPLVRSVADAEIQTVIRQYLERNVLGFPAPDRWFTDRARYMNLYKSLNGLTGACSAFYGNGERPMRFANLPLLAVAALREYWLNSNIFRSMTPWEDNLVCLQTLVAGLEWPREVCDGEGSYFLPRKPATDPFAIVKSLTNAFPKFMTRKDDATKLNLVGMQLYESGAVFLIDIENIGKWSDTWLRLEHQWMKDLATALTKTADGGVDVRFAVTIGDVAHKGRQVTKFELARRAE
jgi:hypothetical protein